MGVIDRFSFEPPSESTIVGNIISSFGSGASLNAISGGPYFLIQCCNEFLGTGYTKTIADYPTFDARLSKRCLQEISSVVFETLDLFSITKFIVTRLKGAEYPDWIQSRQSLRWATETGELSLPGLIDVVNNNIGLWPLIASYLKETGKKDSGDSLVVCFFLLVSILAYLPPQLSLFLFKKKELDGYFYIDQLGRMKFRFFYLILELCCYFLRVLRSFNVFKITCGLCREILGANMYLS